MNSYNTRYYKFTNTTNATTLVESPFVQIKS